MGLFEDRCIYIAGFIKKHLYISIFLFAIYNAYGQPEDYNDWSFSEDLYLNTTVTGANVSGDVLNFPLLIRLDSNNFNFSEAKSDGTDIRFAKSDGSHLSFELERWDNSNELAEFWVLCDVIYGNNYTQYIKMYWGKSDAADSSDAQTVFATTNGFVGVWHLDSTSSVSNGTRSPFLDVTSNGYHGQDYVSANGQTGIIYQGQEFDALNDYIKLGTFDPSATTITLSAWVYWNGDDGSDQVIFSKRNSHIAPLSRWQFYYEEGINNLAVSSGVSGPLDFGVSPTVDDWTHLVMTSVNGSSNNTKLYLNGLHVDSDQTFTWDVKADADVFIGNSDALESFNGYIDEARICSSIRSADWIKLCYETQRTDQTLIVFNMVSFTIDAIDNASVNENTAYTSVTPNLSGDTPIGDITYTISGGADAALFTINASTGVVSMIARDFEAPADANADNVYEIEITATDDDNNADAEDWTVTVIGTHVAPIAYSDNVTTNEDQQIIFNVLDNDQNPGSEILTTNLIGQSAQNGTVSLSATGDLTYNPDKNYYGLDSLTYTVYIEDAPNYCDTERVLITVNPINDPPIAENITLDVNQAGIINICLPVEDVDSDECLLTEIHGTNYGYSSTWSNNTLCFDYEVPEIFPIKEDLVCIICDNGVPMGCDTATVTLNYKIEDLFRINEGISPNGDGVNDTWIILGIEHYSDNNVKIYNRWGSLIFETDHYNNTDNSWDGTMNRGMNLGKKATPGTYFYILKLKSINQVKTGYLILN